MKDLTLYSFSMIMALMVSFSLQAQKIDFTTGDWESIKEQAQKEGKPIFVDAYTTWCGPCKWMDKNVFTDEEVIDYYNKNFVNYKLDMEKGEGPEFATNYGVNAYPTLLYISGAGEIVHKMVGSLPPAKFLEAGEVAKDPSRNIGSLINEYKGGNRSPEFLKKYVSALQGANMDISEVAEEYTSTLTDSELVTKDNYSMMLQATDGLSHPFFNTIYSKREAFAKLMGMKNVYNDLVMVAKGDVYQSLLMQDANKIKLTNKRLASLDKNISGPVQNFADMITAQKNGDHGAYKASLAENFKKYSKNDWQELNSMAWNIYEDEKHAEKDYLKLGMKMAKRSVKLESNFYNTDTYAALLFKAGKFKKAEKFAMMAINHAKSSNEDHKETDALLTKIRAKI